MFIFSYYKINFITYVTLLYDFCFDPFCWLFIPLSDFINEIIFGSIFIFPLAGVLSFENTNLDNYMNTLHYSEQKLSILFRTMNQLVTENHFVMLIGFNMFVSTLGNLFNYVPILHILSYHLKLLSREFILLILILVFLWHVKSIPGPFG